MPLDQAQASTLRALAQSFLQFLGEEAQEGHHPPNPQQHATGLGGGDVNEPPSYAQNPSAAGMLLMAPDGRALFVRRAANARDHAGAWSIPGGMTEGDEMPWQTAQREMQEETGQSSATDVQLLDHAITGDLGFTTFGGKVGDNFNPTLNEEHDGFQWALPQDAPRPLHPGLKATLDFAMDPLTEKGSKIMQSMKSQYGPEKGERVFYASKNKGTISGVDDSYLTTGRQDTQIPRPHPVNSRIATPFNANVDWASPPQTDPSSAPPLATRRVERDSWKSPSQEDSWRSPRQDQKPLTAVTTPHKAMMPAARKPVAATAGSHQLVPSRRIRRSGGDAGGGAGGWGHQGETPPTQKGANDLSRFVLRDTRTGADYAIDQPLPAEFHPIADSAVTEDAGGGAGGWGHAGLAPPTQSGANTADAWGGGGVDPTDPAGQGSAGGAPPLPTAGVGGGLRGGTSQHMPGNPMATAGAGPKLTQSIKMDYGGGIFDERKIVRPMAGASPPPMPDSANWGSPTQNEWASPSQHDRGWPTAGTLGPSPMGGRAGSRGGAGAGRV